MTLGAVGVLAPSGGTARLEQPAGMGRGTHHAHARTHHAPRTHAPTHHARTHHARTHHAPRTTHHAPRTTHAHPTPTPTHAHPTPTHHAHPTPTRTTHHTPAPSPYAGKVRCLSFYSFMILKVRSLSCRSRQPGRPAHVYAPQPR